MDILRSAGEGGRPAGGTTDCNVKYEIYFLGVEVHDTGHEAPAGIVSLPTMEGGFDRL